MAEEYTIPLSRICKEMGLVELYSHQPLNEIMIRSREVDRPALELNGFCDYYDPTRIATMGRSEYAMLSSLEPVQRRTAIDRYFALRPPVVIIARGLTPMDEMMHAAKEYGVPILSSQDGTSALMASLVAFLNVQLAPRITRHGVLVEVYGEGILLIGDSGVGKSEIAIELIKRGHRLVADDAVEIRRVSSKALVGQSPENIRHFIELRGVGVINARRIFGMGSVKPSQKIEMIINMEVWDPTKVYDRIGIDSEFTEILGIKLPVVTIPVKPGRNLAVIVEVAAMNHRQKEMGYNAARELLISLGMDPNDLEAGEVQVNLDI